MKNYVSPFTDKTILGYTNGDGTKGTAVSKNYRIPALVTMPDGTLVAAADARWNTYFDGGGLDTAVAYSKDDGKSWTAYLANYLGDNGNVWNSNSTTFIDPALAADGEKLYMLVDIYPYGIALNGGVFWPVKDTGFHANGKLALIHGTRTSKPEDFTYYLGDVDETTGYAYIYDSDDTIVPDYKVDARFNLFSAQDGSYISNLFMENGIFEVMPAAYLYLTSSEDSGKTWSAPTLLKVKTEDEFACLVGPGRGLTTSKGVILFACYSFQRQQTGLIYSGDNGKTWKRFESLPDDLYWSGEATIVELKNGKIRCFFRNNTCCLCYVDITVDENGIPVCWGEPVKTDVRMNSNTQLCAIAYSKKIDGCETILISGSCGMGEEGSDSCQIEARSNGKIFVGLLDENGEFCVKYSHRVTAQDAFYAYSCLTELADGRVGLLYEKESTVLDFVVYDIKELAADAVITE